MKPLLDKLFEHVMSSLIVFDNFSHQKVVHYPSKGPKEIYATVSCDRGGNYRDRNNVPIDQRKKEDAYTSYLLSFEIYGKDKVMVFGYL